MQTFCDLVFKILIEDYVCIVDNFSNMNIILDRRLHKIFWIYWRTYYLWCKTQHSTLVDNGAKKDLKFSFRCILPYGQLYIELKSY